MTELAAKHMPETWQFLPEDARDDIVLKALEDVPIFMRSFMSDMKANIDEVLDIHHMVVSNLVKNKSLMNKVCCLLDRYYVLCMLYFDGFVETFIGPEGKGVKSPPLPILSKLKIEHVNIFGGGKGLGFCCLWPQDEESSEVFFFFKDSLRSGFIFLRALGIIAL